MTRILRVDASQTLSDSATRELTESLVERLSANGTVEVDHLDLAATPVAPLTEEWIKARLVAPEDRSAEQKAALAGSDALIERLKAADILIIGAPIYNFGVPAPLKAWIDMMARPGVTFRYTAEGPVGLISGKKAYLAIASGGTAVDSPIDFATPWLRHVLGFIGVTDVTVIDAAQGMSRPNALDQAKSQILEIAAA